MLKCEFCHKDIPDPWTDATRFCSQICAGKSKTAAKEIRNIRVCKHCGKEFILENIAYERRGYGTYCSIACRRFATKKFSLNESYFHDINSEDKAYWLGFCFADAYNSGDELRFNLAIKDMSHLYKLQNSLESNKFPKESKDNKFCNIRFGSRILCNDLINLGCVPKKSLILKYPTINSIYDRDFIRGVFDGDGCMYFGHGTRQWSIYSGSEQFIAKIHEILLQKGIGVKLRKQGIGFVISLTRKSEINKIYHYMYDNSSLFLERKRNKFIEAGVSC
jgi:hypothetical protein